jgi:NACHT domain
VLGVLADPARRLVVLLGDPGSGNSTLARYVTLALAGGDAADTALGRLDDHVPLLVELRSYIQLRDRCETFVDFIDHLARTEKLGLERDLLDRHLRQDDRAVVTFDGLDEVFDPRERETRRPADRWLRRGVPEGPGDRDLAQRRLSAVHADRRRVRPLHASDLDGDGSRSSCASGTPSRCTTARRRPSSDASG